MKKRRNQNPREKGITLIALVISIIILVILAAVAVRGITGDEPLIKKTETTAEDYGIEAGKKQIEEAVSSIIISFAQTGEEITHLGIADKLKEESTWIKTAVANQDPSLTGEDIIVETVEGNAYQVYYDALYGAYFVEYIGEADGRNYPNLKACFEKSTETITANANDSQNGIEKIEIIYRGEIVEQTDKSEITYQIIGSGWYTIKATSKTGKMRYAWLRGSLLSNGLAAPVIEIIESGKQGQEDWYGSDNQPVIVRISTDNDKAKKIHYELTLATTKTEEIDGKSITLDGINTLGVTHIVAWSIDAKGRMSNTDYLDIKYDNIKPEIIRLKEEGDKNNNESEWYKGNVTLGIESIKEENSGPNGYYYTKQGGTENYINDITKPIPAITEEGQTVIAIQAIDKAGNRSEPETATIYKDSIPPQIFTPTIENETTEGFKIIATTTDGGDLSKQSGIDHYDIYVKKSGTIVKEDLNNQDGILEVDGLEAGQTYNVYAIAYDKAGNPTTSQTTNVTLKLPLLAPRVEITGTHNPGYENSGWYKTVAVTVTDTAKETLGGTEATQLRLTGSHTETKPMDANGRATFEITAEGGNLQVTAYAVDSSGTQSPGTNSQTFKRDGTAPTMNGNPTATPATLTSITITPTTAQDTVSGLQGYKYYVDGTIQNSTPTTSINYAASTTT